MLQDPRLLNGMRNADEHMGSLPLAKAQLPRLRQLANEATAEPHSMCCGVLAS